MGENSDLKISPADSTNSRFVDSLKQAAAVLSALKEIVAAFGAFGLTFTWAVLKGWYTPPLPAWLIVLAGAVCSGLGAVVQYSGFARKQIASLNARLSKLEKVSKLEGSQELKDCVWQAVNKIWGAKGDGPADKEKALSLAVLGINRLEETAKNHPISVVETLLGQLQRAVVDAGPRDTDEVYLLDTKFYIVMRNQRGTNARKLPGRIRNLCREAQESPSPGGGSLPKWKVNVGVADFDMPYGNPERREERILALLGKAESEFQADASD
jgi:hypothetical protein